MKRLPGWPKYHTLNGMESSRAQNSSNPQGERNAQLFSPRPWPVDTPGGRFYAEWDDQAPVTREGQLLFFFQFLHISGLWREFLHNCPLLYVGNRGSGADRVMATILMSVLNGHWRYAHINAVRGDGINPGLLGVSGTVSEDAVRLALARINENEGLKWIGKNILKCISPALSLPWILDMDVTVKPIYGHQEGAVVGYNPQKPGRPSHVYHSYFVANLRISLGVDVLPGNEHAAANGLPGLWKMLDQLPRNQWPTFTRGDCGYGNEAVISEHEERALPYLFKLRHTLKVKELVRQMMHQGADWLDCGDGWQAMEARLQLTGWSRKRRVVLVRENPAVAPAGGLLETEKGTEKIRKPRRGKDRQSLFPKGFEKELCAAPWSGKIAVLVTSLDITLYPAVAMPWHYRSRADAENAFDELKNQWGWSGFTTHRLKQCRLMANLIALIYNWWNLYARMYDEKHHREAIRSRPMLMAGVGRQVQSGGRRTIRVSVLYEKGALISQAVTLISKELQEIFVITERWSQQERWTLFLTRILRHWLGGKWLPGLRKEAEMLLSG